MFLQVKLIFAVCIYTYAPVHTCCKLNVNFVRSLARPECTNNCMHVACTVRPVVDPSCSTRRYPALLTVHRIVYRHVAIVAVLCMPRGKCTLWDPILCTPVCSCTLLCLYVPIRNTVTIVTVLMSFHRSRCAVRILSSTSARLLASHGPDAAGSVLDRAARAWHVQ
jgi:hypothetical protein